MSVCIPLAKKKEEITFMKMSLLHVPLIFLMCVQDVAAAVEWYALCPQRH